MLPRNYSNRLYVFIYIIYANFINIKLRLKVQLLYCDIDELDNSSMIIIILEGPEGVSLYFNAFNMNVLG